MTLDNRRVHEMQARRQLNQQHPQNLSEIEIAQVYRYVFGTPEGQRVLADICYRLCGIGNAIWSHDSAIMAHNAAVRDMGERIAHYALDPIDNSKPEVIA
jgi:hypothetical protein